MKAKSKLRSLSKIVATPRELVARLILADLIAKRGEGPLQRRPPISGQRKL